MRDEALKDAILDALHARGAGKTLCPSEVARRLDADWRALMPDIRRVGQGLCDAGRIAITQKGQPVDATTAKGPIRFGLPVSSD